MRQELPETATKQVLRGIIAPLHKQRSTVLERIAELSAALAAEREALTDIDAVLRRLDPSALPAKPTKGPARRQDGQVDGRALFNARRAEEGRVRVTEAVRQIVTNEHDLIADGFTKTDMYEWLRARGVACSHTSVSPVIEAMHANGELRLDRVTKGGGQLYKFVGNGAS